MSCNYADGLSPYANKGILGIPERFDSSDDVDTKCEMLAKWIKEAQHVVVHTGAGISTTAGIPDFRGPKGVWTLEKKGEKPNINISFDDAIPTKTHMALCALLKHGYIKYIVSQNIDGLHMKSGLNRDYIAELHGNMFIEQCNKCQRQFIRTTATPTVGKKPCGGICRSNESLNQRGCRSGVLIDNILDWEHDLPERDLDMAIMHSTLADINITLGTTLQIIPSGNLPLKNKKYDGKVVICNLQPTKHDKKADLLISTFVDDILGKVCKRLGIEIPEYDEQTDPTKFSNNDKLSNEWTIPAKLVKDIDTIYKDEMKARTLAKRQLKIGKLSFNDIEIKSEEKLIKKKRKIKTELE